AEQIAQARAHPAVEYRQASAEASGLDDVSADVAVAAQAAHWFDLARYYAEVRRVVRPGGLVALLAYGVVHVDRDLTAIVDRFYWQTLAGDRPPGGRLVGEGECPFPLPVCGLPGAPFPITGPW